MNKVKRILAVVLAMAMVMAMSVTTLAAGEGGTTVLGTSADKGMITVSGIDPMDNNVTAVAYKIIEAKYEGTGGKFSGYNSLYPNVTFKADGSVDISEDKLSEIMKSVVGTTGITMNRSEDKASFSATSVDVGSYLVVIQNAETKIYSPVVVSTAYKNESGTYDIENGNVSVLANGNAWAKVLDKPGLDKVINGSDETVKGNTANIGDTVSYTLTTTIPYYGGSHPKFQITDKLTGLTYKDELTVKVGEIELTKGTHYTVAEPIANPFTIDFVVDGKYTLNEYQGQTLTITYNATVNDDATINQNANTNEATLTYSKDSSQEGQDGTDDSETKTYTFDIDAAVAGSVTEKILTKVGETVVDGKKQPLEGAEFTLYTDSTCNTKYTNTVFKGVVSSDEGGQLRMKGLKQGTYYLKETKAPAGYSLLDAVYEIKIDATVKDAGELTGWTITVNGDTINDGAKVSTFTVNNGETTTVTPAITEVDIPNTKLSELPSTGGIGITIFTIVGCLIMIAAASMFFMSRRKTEE